MSQRGSRQRSSDGCPSTTVARPDAAASDLDQEAGVNRQCNPGHIAGLVRRKPENSVRDVDRLGPRYREEVRLLKGLAKVVFGRVVNSWCVDLPDRGIVDHLGEGRARVD